MSRLCSRPGCGASLAEKRADAVWCSRACYIAAKRAASAYKAPTPKRRPPSGPQVSFKKAAEAVAQELEHHGVHNPQHRAELILKAALPARQRARLTTQEGHPS